jgi:hypothetical protein
MPALVCVGTVDKIGEPKKSQNPDSPYWMLDITLRGMPSAPKTTYTRLLANPDWLSPEFDPSRHLTTKGEQFVYGMNMAFGGTKERRKEDAPALVTIFLGGDAALNALFDERTAQAYVESNGDPVTTLGVAREVLAEAVQGRLIGYILSQKREVTGTEEVTKDDGKTFTRNIYLYDTRYEIHSPNKYVGDFFIPSEKSIRYLESQVTKTALTLEDIAAGKNPYYSFKMTFLPAELGL